MTHLVSFTSPARAVWPLAMRIFFSSSVINSTALRNLKAIFTNESEKKQFEIPGLITTLWSFHEFPSPSSNRWPTVRPSLGFPWFPGKQQNFQTSPKFKLRNGSRSRSNLETISWEMKYVFIRNKMSQLKAKPGNIGRRRNTANSGALCSRRTWSAGGCRRIGPRPCQTEGPDLLSFATRFHTNSTRSSDKKQ